MVNMRGNICTIDLRYKNDQYSILTNTITIVDANEPEMLSRKLFSEYVKINCATSLNHFPIQKDIGPKLSKTVNYIHIHGSNKSLSNSVGGSVA
tara:strand:+ start:274 stop:555 length:282 start_codon:yes stop_codon:yes gene_type:complete